MMGLGGDEDKMENGSGGGGFFESFKVKSQGLPGAEGRGRVQGGVRGGVTGEVWGCGRRRARSGVGSGVGL